MLDDVTGRPVQTDAPLSAREREQRILAIIARMDDLTLQSNALTEAVRGLRVKDASQTVHLASMQLWQNTQPTTIWQRVRWLVRG
jgi:hypothetical protein